MTDPDPADRLPLVAPALRAAARRFGTPVYATDVPTLDAACAGVREAFPEPWLRHFSVKANDVPGVIRLVAARGFGANVVSRGEWAAARAAGVPNERITFEGIGKAAADLRAAVRASALGWPLRWLAIESPDEASALATLASGRAGARDAGLDILFRVNPSVDAETHRGLAVGTAGSKFGMIEAEIQRAIEALEPVTARAGPIRLRGIHLHVGSQLGAVDAWRDGVRRALAVFALLAGSIPDFDTLDVGGGFPIAPLGQPSPSPARFAAEVPALLDATPADRRPALLAIEPGRALVARAGFLVARVLHVRDRGERQVVLDAGMTELIRPALYGATHPIVALTSLGRAVDDLAAATPARVEGPICESTDELGEHHLPPLRRGDLVAIRDAGAYAASISSTYNGRPRAPQVLLHADGRLERIRARGRTSGLAS